MSRTLFTLSAVALGLALPASAEHERYQPISTTTTRTLHTYYPDGHAGYDHVAWAHERQSWRDTAFLPATDVRTLDEIYTHHSQAAADLRAQMDHFQGASDWANRDMAGRMMVDHLILASRARQQYLASDTMFPERRFVARAPMGGEEWRRYAEDNSRRHSEFLRTASVSDPRMTDLVRYSSETFDRQASMWNPPATTVTVITVTPIEQVAGVRQVLSDEGILRSVYEGQMKEAHGLRADAEAIRSANAQLADLYVKMAGDHENLANQARELMGNRNFGIPQIMMPDRPAQVSSPAESVRHWYSHHEEGLAKNGNFFRQAQDPALRQLLNTAIEGTNQHLTLLDPFRDQYEQ